MMTELAGIESVVENGLPESSLSLKNDQSKSRPTPLKTTPCICSEVLIIPALVAKTCMFFIPLVCFIV
jgi:hypothetical protein